MQAILKYTLPEEREEFEMSQKGILYHIALSDIADYLRSKLKYEELSETESKIYEEIRTKFYEILNDNEISV